MSDEARGKAPSRLPGLRPGRPGGMGRGPFGGGPMGGMGAPVQKAKDAQATLNALGAYLKPQRAAIIAVLALATLGTVFSIFGPKVLGQATTALFEGIMGKMMGIPGAGADFGYIGGILLTLLCLYALSATFGYVQQWVMAGIAQRTVYKMRLDVREKLDRLPLRYFDGRPHGEILSRITNDIDMVSTTLSQSLGQIITSLVTILGVLVMMLTISPLLTLIGIVTLPLAGIVTGQIMSRSRKHFAEQQKRLGAITGQVEEVFGGHPIVKAFGQEEAVIKAFELENEALYQSAWRANFVSGLVMPLMNVINNLGYVAVAVAGGVMAAQRTLALGDIQAFIQYLRQFSMPIAQVANIANVIQSTIASAERVFEILGEEEEKADPSPAALPETREGRVEVENLCFSYEASRPLIEGLNVAVEPGQVVAIVGPTGAGKTTLVNLLMRFYEARSGRILVDGVDARAMRRADLRRRFGMVLQDAWLFTGTIRDNIAFGRAGASDNEVIEAARAAHADHFIRTLPQGYDTLVNEEASNLSQGQKQLVTIARAILADPEILILDEATSSVDTRTEMYIQNAMLALMKARTSFVIAHRLSTIREANHILVMNEGSIIEQGTHADLLSRGGFYTELYKSQFEGGVE